jgi:hypothetical protein
LHPAGLVCLCVAPKVCENVIMCMRVGVLQRLLASRLRRLPLSWSSRSPHCCPTGWSSQEARATPRTQQQVRGLASSRGVYCGCFHAYEFKTVPASRAIGFCTAAVAACVWPAA